MLGVRLFPGLAIAAAAAAMAAAPASAGDGSFASSAPLLNRIWTASVATARDMVAPGPLSVDSAGVPCVISEPTVILDGYARDRCPYIDDEAVTGMTLLLSTPSAQPALRGELAWFADNQLGDGAIPASPRPLFDGTHILFDSASYWVQSLYAYALYSGDTRSEERRVGKEERTQG